MFYTGLEPYSLKEVYVAKDPHEKAMQRALLQYFNPKNKGLVIEALRKAGRHDLIGYSDKCLVTPNKPIKNQGEEKKKHERFKRKK